MIAIPSLLLAALTVLASSLPRRITIYLQITTLIHTYSIELVALNDPGPPPPTLYYILRCPHVVLFYLHTPIKVPRCPDERITHVSIHSNAFFTIAFPLLLHVNRLWHCSFFRNVLLVHLLKKLLQKVLWQSRLWFPGGKEDLRFL